MKVRKKPIVIDGWPWNGSYIFGDLPPGLCVGHFCGPSGAHVHSPEGNMKIQPGDWVMRGVEGEYYVCAKSVFEKTYDIVSPHENVSATECEALNNHG